MKFHKDPAIEMGLENLWKSRERIKVYSKYCKGEKLSPFERTFIKIKIIDHVFQALTN